MPIKNKNKKETVLILIDIRSVYNVGAIFRTADAVGISKIYLAGYTPGPTDRFGGVRKDFQKTALGSDKSVKYEIVSDPENILKTLKKDGFEIVAVEQSERSIDYKKYQPPQKTAIIFGNEVFGIARNILRLADVIIEIPMRGFKESLNVSVSSGIVLFRLLDR